MGKGTSLLYVQVARQPSCATYYPCLSSRKVTTAPSTKLLENYAVALELLKKAEAFTDEGDRYRAVTYNNFACIFRRTKKLRSALSYLEKALEIEYNYLHFSQQSVDECLQISNPCDIHLNICAILSQMGKHELAL